jgi:hypothetical protein
MIRPLLLSLCVAGLYGCASAPTAQTDALEASDTTIDVAKVAAIERAAYAQGVKVIWVNKPQRRTAGG